MVASLATNFQSRGYASLPACRPIFVGAFSVGYVTVALRGIMTQWDDSDADYVSHLYSENARRSMVPLLARKGSARNARIWCVLGALVGEEQPYPV